MTPVNSIELPARFVELCCDWYDGSGSMLYAVASTGGLTTGTICPVTDYDDRDRKWYYQLWVDLSVDVMYARRAAQKASLDNADHDDYLDLVDFEDYADSVVERLCEEYGLDDYEG